MLRDASRHCAYTQVLVLAKSALEAAQSEPVQALCYCLLARALHAQGQWDAASKQYAAALQRNPNLGLAHLGLAQLYVRQNNIINASTELDLALKASPGLFEALKVDNTHTHTHRYARRALLCTCARCLGHTRWRLSVCVCVCVRGVCVCVYTDRRSGRR